MVVPRRRPGRGVVRSTAVFFFSDFFESSSSAFGFAFPCVATGTEAGVAAIVLAELR